MTLHELLDHLDGVERRDDQYFARCPAHEDRTASLSIAVAEDGRTLLLHCFGTCTVEMIVAALGFTMADLFPPRPRAERRRIKRAVAKRPKVNGERTFAIQRMLSATVPDDGTISSYLKSRGLSGAVPETLHLHRGLDYLVNIEVENGNGREGWDRERRGPFPAIIAQVRRIDGTVASLHRTWLAPDGSSKADVPEPKKLMPAIYPGATNGAAIHLAEPAGDRLALVEGIETGLAVMEATGAATWACVSAGGLNKIELPAAVRIVDIYADHDAAGIAAAQAAAARLSADGHVVRVLVPPRDDDDWLDVLVREGAEAVRDAQETEKAQAMTESGADSRTFEGPGRSATENLPAICTSGRLRRVIVNEAIVALERANDPPVLYLDESGPVRARMARQRPTLEPLSEIMLSDHLDSVADFYKIGRRDTPQPTEPPPNVVKVMLSRHDLPLPRLDGISETPILRSDGTIVTERGYDAPSARLYIPRPGFVMPRVPERPTAAQIAEARALILDHLLVDFPFVDGASRANAVALLLTAVCRPAIDGLIPLALLDKPSPGTGATLLANLVSYIASGEPVAAFSASRGEEEWRKWLTSVLLTGAPIVLIDNVKQRLGSASLLAALTAPSWADRLLGGNKIAHLPQRAVWVATGNNLALGTDMARRAYWMRLDAKLERPAERPIEHFKHSNIERWTLEHRGELLAALFTLARAWYARECPTPHVRTMGGFVGWTTAIGGILEAAGVTGFLGNVTALYEVVDEETDEFSDFIATWHIVIGEAPTTVAELRQRAEANETLRAALPAALRDALDAKHFGTKLGNALRVCADRLYAVQLDQRPIRLKLERAAKDDTHAKTARWRVVEVAADARTAPGQASAPQSGECVEVAGTAGTADADSVPNRRNGRGKSQDSRLASAASAASAKRASADSWNADTALQAAAASASLVDAEAVGNGLDPDASEDF